MKKIFLLISLIFTANLNAANLFYTKAKTPSKSEVLVKYAKKVHPNTGLNDYIAVFDPNTTDAYWDKINPGIPKPKFYYSKSVGGRHIGNAEHYANVLHAFYLTAGTEFGQRLISYSMSVSEQNMFYGIASYSGTGDDRNRWDSTSKMFYFGDIINETAISSMSPRRVYGDDETGNVNLFLKPLGNPVFTIDSEIMKNSTGVRRNLAYLTPETMKYDMYGDEVFKLLDSERIYVGQFECVKNNKGTDVTNPATLSSTAGAKTSAGRASQFSSTCRTSSEPDDAEARPVYSRSSSVMANGDIYDRKKEEQNTGTSFSAPKLAGIAALIQKKYPGITYHEIKQMILTTAYREKDALSNDYGWGFVDERKVLNGPSNFNAGLIEEQKFFTGFYDKVFEPNSDTAYFWAEPLSDWTWTNDIRGELTYLPSGTTSYNVAVEQFDNKKGDIVPGLDEFSVVDNVPFKNYISREKNFYEKTSDYKGGLRKAGDKTLIIKGNISYRGKTEVLGGALVLEGNVSNTDITVFDNATLVLNGSNQNVTSEIEVSRNGYFKVTGNNVHIANLFLEDGANFGGNGKNIVVDKLIVPENRMEEAKAICAKYGYNVKKFSAANENYKIKDVEINEKKFADIPREFYFNNFKSAPKYISDFSQGNFQKYYSELEKRYKHLPENPYFEKDPDVDPFHLDDMFGMSNRIVGARTKLGKKKDMNFGDASEIFIDK